MEDQTLKWTLKIKSQTLNQILKMKNYTLNQALNIEDQNLNWTLKTKGLNSQLDSKYSNLNPNRLKNINLNMVKYFRRKVCLTFFLYDTCQKVINKTFLVRMSLHLLKNDFSENDCTYHLTHKIFQLKEKYYFIICESCIFIFLWNPITPKLFTLS